MTARVLLDMDGVIADFYESFAAFLNKNYGCSLPLDQEPSIYSINEWGYGADKVDIAGASQAWIMQGGMKDLSPYDGAGDFVRALSDMCTVYIVTARVGDWQTKMPVEVVEKIKSDTTEWLDSLGIDTSKLFFSHEKVDFCLEHGISILVEDKMSTALEAAKSGLHTILVNRGWNGSKMDRYKIYRTYGYDDVLNTIKRLI